MTRLNDPKTGKVVLIQQRLHEDDWSGAMVATGVWDRLSLPAIAEINEALPFGKKIFVRPAGDPLHPIRMPLAELAKIRAEIGSSLFSTQYQQRPVSSGEPLLDMQAFRRFDIPPKKRPGDLVVHSWDVAYTQEKHSDFSVCSIWLHRDYCLFLLNIVRVKKTYPELKRMILFNSHKADAVVIEGGPLGTPLWQELRRNDARKYVVAGAQQAKDVRLMSVRYLIESGRVWLPKAATFLPEFIHELSNFPNSKHDDQVDSFSQALRWMRRFAPQPPNDWKPPKDDDLKDAA